MIVMSLLALQFLALLIPLLRQVKRSGLAGAAGDVPQPAQKTISNPSFVFDYRKIKLCLETFIDHS